MRRKIEGAIEDYLRSFSNKLMVVEGARQVGKSYTIREVGKRLFKNYIEINMEHDKQHDRLFAAATTEESFYMALSSIAGRRMGSREDIRCGAQHRKGAPGAAGHNATLRCRRHEV